MKVGIVGGGILGLTLAHRLSGLGHTVEVLEAAPHLGGLACSHDYGSFTWDRFYHVILPTDRALLGLVRELGLESELRWTQTGTGYYARGAFYNMNGNADFLRFPLLDLVDKSRLAATVIYAGRFADPWPLYRVTAEEWLTRFVGPRGYRTFWQPLLKAKFGPYHDQVAAVFIWATLTRLFGARSKSAAKEKMGYVRGGYRRILEKLGERFAATGVSVRTGAKVTSIAREGDGCVVESAGGARRYDQVFFTGPTRLAAEVARGALVENVVRATDEYPTSEAYLGVCCLVMALKKPLTPWYVLNVGDESIEVTGVIEMTNLINRDEETRGHSLVYVPQYLDSRDPRLDAPDEELVGALVERGLKRLYPEVSFDAANVAYRGIHRARYVQPLPLARADAGGRVLFPLLERPFTILNTSMLACATLNNNEVVGLVDRFIEVHGRALARPQ